MNPTFLKPQYGSRCFADIPATLAHLLTGQGQATLAPEVLGSFDKHYDAVVLMFIDAFGWRFYNQYKSHPVLSQLTTQGQVAKLTSQFPSTTAAHVTSIHSGQAVGQSGVFEWYYYEPQLDALIAPLLFSYAGTWHRDTLRASKVSPASLYPSTTFYEHLAAQGVKSTVYQHRDFTPSTYSDQMLRGATVMPYRTLTEALVNLRSQLLKAESPAYHFFYSDQIDLIGHWYGPGSVQFAAEVDTFLTLLDRQFIQPLAGKLSNTLLIMTADHGQVDIDPATTIYLNQGETFDGLTRFLRTSRRGEVLVPGGSARDLFLYVHDSHLDEAQAFLAERLVGRADVMKVADLIDEGYFGPARLSTTFLARVGNLVILPYAGESVWWYEKGKYEQLFRGHHGGLTPEEMEIALILRELG